MEVVDLPVELVGVCALDWRFVLIGSVDGCLVTDGSVYFEKEVNSKKIAMTFNEMNLKRFY